MPCLIGCLALFTPRLVIILLALFSDYLSKPFDTWVWPVLGFLFLPLTTLAYAWAWHYGDGQVSGIGMVVVVLAILVDVGLIGTGESSRRRYQSRVG